MRKLRKKSMNVLLLSCLVLLSSLAPAGAAKEPVYCCRYRNTKVDLSFEDKVQNWLDENNVPAVGIGLIEEGEIKYIKVFGELKKGVPAPENTIFNLASMTKPVVAILTLKLVHTGQWDLDEPLAKYWIDPDVKNNPFHKKLTTRHVLTHQTGFANWRRRQPGKKLAFDFEPGTQYQYSGEGFEYLRRALEHKFNKPLEELLETLLFTPLEMKDTQYWNENVDTARFARWHDTQGNEYHTSYQTKVNAADDLLTTVEDYCKFMVYVLNGAELSTDLLNDMVRCQVNIKSHYGKGLGWGIVFDSSNGEYALEHAGGDKGVKAMGIILPITQRGVVVFTNGDNGMIVCNNVIREALDVGQEIFDYTFLSPYNRPTVKLPDDVLERYVGAYDKFNIHITREGDALKLSAGAMPTMILDAEGEDKFFTKWFFNYQFEFIKDESNKVIKLNVYEDGKQLCSTQKR